MYKHCENAKRSIHIVNLDPAAEIFNYPVSIDIRDLITIDDVMDTLGYGPNGSLVYCMEYLLGNKDWLNNKLGDFDEDYLIFDLPGQIELYTHINVMKNLVKTLQDWGYNVCALYLVDSSFLTDSGKFISVILQALSAMIHLELPHTNLITKMDLLPPGSENDDRFAPFFDADILTLMDHIRRTTPKRYHNLNIALAELIDDFNMVTFLPLNVQDEESITNIMSHVDFSMQYGEDLEPKDLLNDEYEDFL
eukprot:TRINITY_DN4716_c0_g1_i1.p1 TRINITY_DN4716_c0_g1~~TRINITY_DN4716_c0_g1_i1.p1  ORF type:complete len:250 (-),score=56.53 TRINITY_DN4716_c0_g1_i1:22-771(-)